MTKTTSKSKTTTKLPTLNDGSIKLTIKINKDKIKSAYGKVIVESAKHVEIKGFRKGKAPIKMVEASLDKSKIYSRVIEMVVPPEYSKALQKGKYRPLIEPNLTPLKMEEGKNWEFQIETAQAPEVKIGDYKKYVKSALTLARKKHSTKNQVPEKNDHYELNAVLDAILKNAQVTPAKILIEHEAGAMIKKLESQLAPLKLKLDDYLKSIKKTKEELQKEYFTTAQNNIRLEFALKEIVEVENPAITDDEIKKANPPQGQESYVHYLLQKQKILDILVQL